MKLKEYLANLKKLVEENPDSLEYEVIYSIDNEGNAYKRVYSWGPTLGIHDDNEFCIIEDDEDEDDSYTKDDINAICIN